MTFASHIGRERVDYACVNFWQENFHLPRGRLARKSCLQLNYNAFSFPWVVIYSKTFKLYLFLRSSIMSTLTKAKQQMWSTIEEKDFLLLCKERAIGDLLEDSHFHQKGLQNITSAANCNMMP